MKAVLFLASTIGCCIFPLVVGDLKEDILSLPCLRINVAYLQRADIIVETPIVFYGQKYSKVLVNSAGFISFRNYISRPIYLHEDNINLATDFSSTPLMTPFFSYLTGGTVCIWTSNNETVIEMFDELFQFEGGFSEFTPSLLFAATWDDVEYDEDPAKTLTFAVILATDGKISFSQYLYFTPIPEDAEFIIGFAAGDGNRSLELVRSTGTLSSKQEEILSIAYRLDGNCVTPATSACNITSFPVTCSPPPNITASCNCSNGYDDLNIEDDMCTDIDECLGGTHNCTPTEKCFNTIGGHICCEMGQDYDVISKECKDINECLEDIHNCTLTEKCFNIFGGHVCCEMNQDYDVISKECKDTDECLEDMHNCTLTEKCFNIIGGYVCCEMNQDYDVISRECRDIDECLEDMHNCTLTEKCFNIIGGHVCCEMDQDYDVISRECKGNIVAQTKTVPPSNTAFVVGITAMAILVVVIVAVVVPLVSYMWLAGARRRRRIPRKRGDSHEYIDNEVDEIKSPNFHHAGSMIKIYHLPKSLKIPFEDLEIEAKMVGEGEFGIVYRAKYQEKAVAVKILKGISGTYEVRQLVEEIVRMKDFSHPNILSLTGVSIDHHFSPCLILPYMWNGSLDYFLQKEENRGKYWFPLDGDGTEKEFDIAAGKLLDMCLQIAKGMVYLSSQKIIHRDLAARNCMMSINNVVKVADFGLAISLAEDKEYFRMSDNKREKLPWKWMAIETLTENKFSEASDVWSFGITCWEIFNGGGKPYPDIRSTDIMREILEGYRMDMPPNKACNESIHDLMKSCWEREPGDRPSFSDLESHISSLIENTKDYLSIIDFDMDKIAMDKHL